MDETNQQRPDFIKVVRHEKQEGLIRSRVSGWRAATAPIVALFDAHVEFNIGWSVKLDLRLFTCLTYTYVLQYFYFLFLYICYYYFYLFYLQVVG